MEKRREARYPDVGAVLEELRRAVRGLPLPTGRSRGGLLVEARVEGEPGDEALEWLDGVLAHAAQEMEAAGLEVKVDGASCLLALASLGKEPAGVRGPSAGGGTHAGGGHRGSKAPSKRRTRGTGPRGGARQRSRGAALAGLGRDASGQGIASNRGGAARAGKRPPFHVEHVRGHPA